MKKIFRIFCVAAVAVMTAACLKEKGQELAPGTFKIDMDQYSVIALDQNAQIALIPVTTNVSEDEWEFDSSASWCHIGRSIGSDKGVMVSVDSNTDKEEKREAIVQVSAAGKTYSMSVIQTGYGPAIIVKNATIGAEGGTLSLDVVSNVDLDEEKATRPAFNADDGENWIRFSAIEPATKGFASTRFVYDIDVNELPDKREAKVEFSARNSSYSKADVTCVITQNSISVTSTDVFSDNKVKVVSVSASQVSSYEGPVENLVDGSYDTYYHSPYEVTTNFPVTLEFTFDGTERIDYISIMHRAYQGTFGSHWRGQFGTVEIYWKNDASAPYTHAQTANLNGAGGYQTIWLDEPMEGAVAVKFEVQDDSDPNHTNYTDGQYISCAEVEFFNTNRSEINSWIEKIFTDKSCSELKSGVTKRDIIQMNAVSPFLATNVAMPLLNGTYDEGEKDFRIHTYEPYADNRVNRALVTRIYSAMNNPTGIEVEQGKDILVCVDKIPQGQSVSLAIYGDRADGEGPNYGGGGEGEGWDQNIELKEGINTVRIQSPGMAYVMNTVPQADPLHPDTTPISSYKSVKVHILPGCGKVQGYYDPARHSEERYKELLNRCTYKYFVVKGEKCMFLFHTNQLRSDFPSSILSGIKAWDDIIMWQHQLMGLDKKAWFNNHMMAVSSTNKNQYMDASHRRVQFNVTTLAKIGSREALRANEGGWGPCHEMGHVNQQAINWKSCTESSNNLFSNYCVMMLAGDDYYKTQFSRGKTIKDLAGEYAGARPWALYGDGSYQNEDPELHMRMNWQLWNYYHNAGYKADFWPTLFEYLRQNPLPSEMAPSYYNRAEDAGRAQLEYYEAACVAAGEDLTEFFDIWGFFIPIDQQYEQYGTVQYKVTEAMINESRARVRAMNLPKAAPIQYLEDRKSVGSTKYSDMGYWEQYRDKVQITKTPKASVNGYKVTLTDCDQAVAVEVRRGTADDGDILYFSNLFEFTSPVNLSGNSLWAVQYDGTRKKVTIGN